MKICCVHDSLHVLVERPRQEEQTWKSNQVLIPNNKETSMTGLALGLSSRETEAYHSQNRLRWTPQTLLAFRRVGRKGGGGRGGVARRGRVA